MRRYFSLRGSGTKGCADCADFSTGIGYRSVPRPIFIVRSTGCSALSRKRAAVDGKDRPCDLPGGRRCEKSDGGRDIFRLIEAAKRAQAALVVR